MNNYEKVEKDGFNFLNNRSKLLSLNYFSDVSHNLINKILKAVISSLIFFLRYL